MAIPEYTPRAPKRKYSAPNDYRVARDGVYIALTDTQGVPTGEAIIDPDDLERVIAYGHWYKQIIKSRNREFEYAACYIRRDSPDYAKRDQRQLLHRLVMDAPAGSDVDHWDGNGLDCRRRNLRVVTRTDNNLNRFYDRRIAWLEEELSRAQESEPNEGVRLLRGRVRELTAMIEELVWGIHLWSQSDGMGIHPDAYASFVAALNVAHIPAIELSEDDGSGLPPYRFDLGWSQRQRDAWRRRNEG